MKVYIHAGLDKSGSSAIQSSLGLNQRWLKDRGYCFPTAGRLFGGTHEGLFKGDDAACWEQLRDELNEADHAGMKAAVLSFEGIHFIEERRLFRFKQYLRSFDLALIIYLRDQAEIIQSGFFQQVKQSRMNLAIQSFRLVNAHLLPDTRNYENLLEKLRRVFGLNALDVRIYDREEFVDHNIVTDFFNALSLNVDDMFHFPARDVNPSLDLPSVLLLNLVDRFFDDPQGRRNLINQLVVDIEKHGSCDKYFLDKPDVEAIRDYYRTSNGNVLATFFSKSEESELFPRASSACQDVSFGEAYSVVAEKISRLANSVTAIIWNGDKLTGSSLSLLCQQENGWSLVGNQGVWTAGTNARLRFVIPAHKFFREDGNLLIHLVGNYSSQMCSQISVKGRVIHSGNIEDGKVEISLAELADGLVDLEIVHQQASGAARFESAGGDTRPGYFLRSISYSL